MPAGSVTGVQECLERGFSREAMNKPSGALTFGWRTVCTICAMLGVFRALLLGILQPRYQRTWRKGFKRIVTTLCWIGCLQLANKFGNGADKLPLDERYEFARDHFDDMVDSAENPIDGRRWWMEVRTLLWLLTIP